MSRIGERYPAQGIGISVGRCFVVAKHRPDDADRDASVPPRHCRAEKRFVS
jgi:hypothetical protein